MNYGNLVGEPAPQQSQPDAAPKADNTILVVGGIAIVGLVAIGYFYPSLLGFSKAAPGAASGRRRKRKRK